MGTDSKGRTQHLECDKLSHLHDNKVRLFPVSNIKRERACRHIAELTPNYEGTLRDWLCLTNFDVTKGKA